MKENFYIFLDIDGVMYDWEYMKKNNIRSFGRVKTFSPDSVEALNYLMQTLNNNYNTELVISSTWRRDMPDTVRTLRQNGVEMNLRKVFSTPIFADSEKRGEEILSYLNGKNNASNYVIIDDEMFDYEKHFNSSRIIKTNIFSGGLNKEMVSTFLKSNNIPLYPQRSEERTL